MANQIQIKRGLEADLPSLAAGEFGLCTDSGKVFIGDGSNNLLVRGDADPVLSNDAVASDFSFVLDEDDMASNSPSKLATQQSIKAYADNLLGANDAMVFKGTIDCSSDPDYPAADAGHTYRISAAGKIGGPMGVNVEVGDIITCLTDGTDSGDQSLVGSDWSIVQNNLDGAVIGPTSATTGNIPTFGDTTGKIVEDSGYAPDDFAPSGHNHDGSYDNYQSFQFGTSNGTQPVVSGNAIQILAGTDIEISEDMAGSPYQLTINMSGDYDKYSSWTIGDNNQESTGVYSGDTVDFEAGLGLTHTLNGQTLTYSIDDSVVVKHSDTIDGGSF